MLTFTRTRIAYAGFQQAGTPAKHRRRPSETHAMTSPYVFALIAALAAVVYSSLTMLLLG
ncbi:hypothetical protein [Paraburkholderia eburnea]|uniref:hypothetical protein n=1 Tax=Paraburkholderia eburnea TaxID=1189126 RepID=UPI0011B0C34D|nr:hypothetical protein [Paraburkholderia eburnea]